MLVERTECDWVHFHDADDLLLPNFIELARRWMTRDDVDVVVFGCEERWEAHSRVDQHIVPQDDLLAADPVGYTIQHKINAISGLYRRRAFLARWRVRSGPRCPL